MLEGIEMKRILIVATLIVILISLVYLAGCSTSREVVHAQKNYYYSKSERNSFLYWTRASKVTHGTPFTTTTVDNIETAPDPNSVKAVSEGASKGLIEGLKMF